MAPPTRHFTRNQNHNNIHVKRSSVSSYYPFEKVMLFVGSNLSKSILIP